MCVSVVQSLYDERKILMKMSSDEPSFLSPRKAGLQDTPSLIQGLALDLSSGPQVNFSPTSFLAETLALDLALAPLLV